MNKYELRNLLEELTDAAKILSRKEVNVERCGTKMDYRTLHEFEDEFGKMFDRVVETLWRKIDGKTITKAVSPSSEAPLQVGEG